MALSLADAEAQVRAWTRHTGDTTRLLPATVRLFLNQRYKELRAWLVDVAPELYLISSSALVIANGDIVNLTAAAANYERVHRVDKQNPNGDWREVERASRAEPNLHVTGLKTWREEGGFMYFGPDNNYAGTYRILYHAVPAALTADADTFALPDILNRPLMLLTCSDVAVADTDDPKDFDKRASEALEGDGKNPGARKVLSNRDGAHQQRAGLQRKMGRW